MANTAAQTAPGIYTVTTDAGLTIPNIAQNNLGAYGITGTPAAPPSSPAATPVTPTQSPASTSTPPATPTTNTYGLTTASPNWYQLQQKETIANYNARIAAANPDLPAPGTTSSTGVTNNAPIAPLPSVISPPTTSGTPTLPQATAPQAVSTYTTGVAATLAAQTAQLTAAYQQQQAQYQQRIDAATQAASDASTMAQTGLADENSVVTQEASAKLAALQTEQQQYNDNYNVIQGLAAQASALVATSQQLTAQMQGTTGLSSIMQPRIAQSAADITAQLAVIKGAVDIYSGAIGSAQAQLKSATDAITSIYGDQISYYQSIVTFYEGQQTKDLTQAASLSTDQKTYIDAQIKQLSDQVASTQATADYISKAMVDPTTALQFATAGVSLSDTIPQITVKLATAAYSAEISATSQKMAAAGYSQTPIPGTTPVTTIDSQGKSTNWYANTKPGTASASTSITEAGGQRLLVDKTTGSVIADLGPATTGSSSTTPGGITFTQAQRTTLQGTGETASSINALQAAINQYGAQSVLDNGQGLSDGTKQFIEDTYGVSPTAAPSSSSNIFQSALSYFGVK